MNGKLLYEDKADGVNPRAEDIKLRLDSVDAAYQYLLDGYERGMSKGNFAVITGVSGFFLGMCGMTLIFWIAGKL